MTEKQKIFVNEYLIDLNATRAYKAAYPSCKKDETAAQAGSRMLRNVKVTNYIEQRMKDREKRTEITQDMVVQELAKIGFADMKDFLSYRTEKTVVGHQDNGEPIFGYAHIIDTKPSEEVDGRVISEVSINPNGTFKFKLHDKMSALEKLGKHLGMFKDNVTVTTNSIPQITFIGEPSPKFNDAEAIKEWNEGKR